jgi:hypothetical protein
MKRQPFTVIKCVPMFIGLLLLAILFVSYGCSSKDETSNAQNNSISAPPTKTIESTIPEISVSSKKIASDYYDNEVAANMKYADKIIQVDGYVFKTKIIAGEYVVQLGMEAGFVVDTFEFYNKQIYCYFSPDEKDKEAIASLEFGKPIKIKGICKGLVLGTIVIENSVIE